MTPQDYQNERNLIGRRTVADQFIVAINQLADAGCTVMSGKANSVDLAEDVSELGKIGMVPVDFTSLLFCNWLITNQINFLSAKKTLRMRHWHLNCADRVFKMYLSYHGHSGDDTFCPSHYHDGWTVQLIIKPDAEPHDYAERS